MDWIEDLRQQGMPFAYSSDLLKNDLRVIKTPRSVDALEAVKEVLADHGLVIHDIDGLMIIGKQDAEAPAADFGTVLLSITDAVTGKAPADIKLHGVTKPTTVVVQESGVRLLRSPPGRYDLKIVSPGYAPRQQTLRFVSGETREIAVTLRATPPAMAEIFVYASHYEMPRDSSSVVTSLDQQTLSQSPDLGNDPIRAVQRLPGAASEGASARSFLRGGTQRETGIVLDGHRLLDPFHVRDYQSLFSAIDVRAVNGVEVYTGGFPVQYGNLSSGLILIDSLVPDDNPRTELGVSVFNTSLLSAGQLSDGKAEWVLSARRGNLDLVLEKKLGEPKYHDVFGKISLDFTPSTTVSANALIVNDIVQVIAASDPDEREESTNDSRNTQFWLNWDQSWTDSLDSRTLFSISDFQSERTALINDTEKIVGQIDDRRDVQISRVVQDWTYTVNDRHRLTWGGEFQSATTDYNYTSGVEYFGFFQNLPGAVLNRDRNIQKDISGDSISFYLADQWQVGKKLVTDIGFRWDKQNYTDLEDNGQFSPRAGLLYRLNSKTNLRLSWGRYYQAQDIHELQVEDGETRFFPSQRSDHTIVGFDRQLNDNYSMRLELYSKSDRRIRPRFENLFDPLTIIPELEADRQLIVADVAKSRGLELSLAYDRDDDFGWWASYVLSETKDRIDRRYVPRNWDQRHALQLGLSWTNGRWSYSVAGHAHSGWPKTDVLLDTSSNPALPTVVFGERNDLRYSSFYSIDMRLEYERPIRLGSFSWFFELSNSTNRNNPCCVDYDLDVNANGDFALDKKEEYWFPLLPATGVLWKF